ncbi:diaminopropionate ammonia-lyase [Castellaniella hirudinis]|uniref:diaminopropionate ammonia-lyase n=1 Tax=Castellaniella hirudinis TaxID=1144617 RepID=UPI0039C3FC24
MNEFSKEKIHAVHAFHSSLENYDRPPLHRLPKLAAKLKVGAVLVKDESERLGLNAFKILGCIYAISKYLAREYGLAEDGTLFSTLMDGLRSGAFAPKTFVTATDGNHGRAVARAARLLGQRAVVYMPQGSAAIRVERIRQEGAECAVTDQNYDETVRHASDMAAAHQWVLMQDTAWRGYEEIPLWIMQGYGTIAQEIREALGEAREAPPTHVILQAGVGSFAGGVGASLSQQYQGHDMTFIIVEPDAADCIFQSIRQNAPAVVTGDLNTVMAGLACGQPSTIGLQVLKQIGDTFITCDDSIAATGVRVLGAPLVGDPRIIAGESGAVGLGVLMALMQKPEHAALRQRLRLDDQARVLIINTEGNTDPASYERITWEGHCPSA